MRQLYAVLATLATAIIASAAGAQSAPPSNWTPLGGSEAGGLFYLDKSTIANEGAYKKVWGMSSFSTPHEVTGDPSKTYLSATSLYLIDCDGRKLGVPQKVYYDQPNGGGRSVSSYTLNNPGVKDAVPGSVGYQIIKIVCN